MLTHRSVATHPLPSCNARSRPRGLIRLASGFGMLVVLVTSACGSGTPSDEVADLVLLGARVYTLDWGEPDASGNPAADAPWSETEGWVPDAEAVAIRGDRVVYVGSNEGALAYRGSSTEVRQMGGAVILPGFVESHAHILSLGNTLFQVDLVGVETEEEAVRRVEARAAEVPAGSWILGRGWDEGAWANRYPDRRLLSERIPDHPVWLRGLHGFAGWANDRALEAAGITRTTASPVGGEIVKDADGEPVGLFLNRAVTLMDGAIPPLTPEETRARVTGALQTLAASGYVALHDAGTQAGVLAALETLEEERALPVRVYAMLNARDAALARHWIARGPRDDLEAFLRVRSVKAYYDAALGSRGARLLADYSDLPGHRGVSGEGYGFDQALVGELIRAGFQVGIHAIGDAGNRETLDFLEALAAEDPGILEHRHRIEHAQVVHPNDFARFGSLRLTASMEPPHAVEDMLWAEDRVGPDRIRGAYAWRTLRQAGAHLVFNADLPGSDHDIFYGLHAAITRRNRNLQPAEGWYREQALTPEEALRAYTSWPAWSAFVEDRTGVIRAGAWADLTILDLDPLRLGSSSQPEAMLQGRVLATVVGGRVVFMASDGPG